LERHTKEQFKQMTPELRQAILDFYSDPNAPITTKKDKKQWAEVVRDVDELKAFTPGTQPAPAASSDATQH